MSASFLESLRALSAAKKGETTQPVDSSEVMFSDDEQSSGDEDAAQAVRIAAKRGRANFGGAADTKASAKARGEFVSLLLPDNLGASSSIHNGAAARGISAVRSTFAALRTRTKRPRPEDELALPTPLGDSASATNLVKTSSPFVPTSFATSDPALVFEATELEYSSAGDVPADHVKAHREDGAALTGEPARPNDDPKGAVSADVDLVATTDVPKAKRSMLERARALAEAAPPVPAGAPSASRVGYPLSSRAGYR